MILTASQYILYFYLIYLYHNNRHIHLSENCFAQKNIFSRSMGHILLSLLSTITFSTMDMVRGGFLSRLEACISCRYQYPNPFGDCSQPPFAIEDARSECHDIMEFLPLEADRMRVSIPRFEWRSCSAATRVQHTA